MSWKDKMKEGIGSSAPKFETTRLEMKESLDSPTGLAFFKWNKETSENELYGNTVKGAIIGQAMMLTSFDSNFGKNGGSMRSNYIFDTDKVSVFGPTGSRLFDGDFNNAKAFMNKVSGDKVSVRKILFVNTDKGICSINTNITIAIDQLKQIGLKASTNMVVITPMVADLSNDSLSPKVIEILGKLAKRNPPKYASIECVEAITDEWAEKTGLESAIDEFIEYRKYNTSKTDKPLDAKPEPSILDKQEDHVNEHVSADDSDDDLPF